MRSSRLFWAVMFVGFGFACWPTTWNNYRQYLAVLLASFPHRPGSLVPDRNCDRDSHEMEMVEGSVDLDDSESASIVVKHGAGKLELTRGSQNPENWSLVICIGPRCQGSQKQGKI